MSSQLKEFNTYLKSKLSTFKCWKGSKGSPQGRFLAGCKNYKTRVFRSGNRNGKTTAGAIDCLLHLMGWHPFQVHTPPVKWWVSALSWEVISEVVWPVMKPWFPFDQVVSSVWQRRAEPSIPIAFIFKNGSELRFKSAEQGAAKYQGAGLHGCWIDEEHPGDVAEEIQARLGDHDGLLTLTLTPLLRYSWIKDLEKEPTTLTVRTNMIEAAEGGLLSMSWVTRFLKMLPLVQRRVRGYGDRTSLVGKVYPSLLEDSHACKVVGNQLFMRGQVIAPWPIPKAWPRRASVDWGFANPSCVLISAEDRRNRRLIFYLCYYAAGIRTMEWAKLLDKRLPKLITPIIADHDRLAREDLEAAGIESTPAIKHDQEAGIEELQRAIVQSGADKLPKLAFLIDEELTDEELGRCDCEKVFWEAELYSYGKKGKARVNVKEAPIKKDDHAMDSLRYHVVSWLKDQGRSREPMKRSGAPRSRDLDLLYMPEDCLL